MKHTCSAALNDPHPTSPWSLMVTVVWSRQVGGIAHGSEGSKGLIPGALRTRLFFLGQ